MREGRIQAFAEDAQALGPKVEHVWVNYQKRRAFQERLTMFPKPQEVIEENRKRLQEQKKWDQNSEEWRSHVKEIAKTRFGGTDTQWEIWCKEILEPYPD